MRLSRYFLPTLKETPSEAQIISHRLMLRCGMIHQATAGIYSWLPMGTRVLRNIEAIVREEQNKTGALEVILPTVQAADLWIESGRYDDLGEEMLRFKDRHQRDLLYTPTAEELITDVARRYIKSYRDLPKIFYQINWKFRDEIRPRFGVMRGREFLMKDCYSFDLNYENSLATYQAMLKAYVHTFKRLGLKALPVKAPTGAIGGQLSHEFHVLAETGESLIYYDKKLESILMQDTIDVDELMSVYTAEEEMHDEKNCPIDGDKLDKKRGIEVGHVFNLGTKYSSALNANVIGPDGKPITLHMGCYGIGVSRLVGAIIEANHDDNGIIWPASVAPFQVIIINLKPDHAPCVQYADTLYEGLLNRGVEVLYDDRSERSGVKFATADLIGIPWQIRVGEHSVNTNTYEIKNRRSSEVIKDISFEDMMLSLKHQGLGD